MQGLTALLARSCPQKRRLVLSFAGAITHYPSLASARDAEDSDRFWQIAIGWHKSKIYSAKGRVILARPFPFLPALSFRAQPDRFLSEHLLRGEISLRSSAALFHFYYSRKSFHLFVAATLVAVLSLDCGGLPPLSPRRSLLRPPWPFPEGRAPVRPSGRNHRAI
jgi:hypothetical protein